MINTVSRKLESDLEAATAQKVRACYQCKKCSAGCPVAFAMDLLPHEVMKMVQYGQAERLLSCETIWLCASCETCSTRCPNAIDIARVMDGLRQMSLDAGLEGGDTGKFHKAFLGGIKYTGRTNEPVLIGAYKAMTRKMFDDVGLAVVMLIKRKISVIPKIVKDRKSVRRIFERTGGEGL